jgi:hypothetical protein
MPLNRLPEATRNIILLYSNTCVEQDNMTGSKAASCSSSTLQITTLIKRYSQSSNDTHVLLNCQPLLN